VIDDDFKEPLESDRPTLLLSGENDPITPPEYAERAMAGGLTNAVHLVGAGQGHGLAGLGCVPRLLRAFLETPKPGELDATCLGDEPPAPFFLSFLGPAP
jgi:pimeloyl-ACP methyl ester carboxylesterase